MQALTVTYIISDIDKSLAFEWIANDLRQVNLVFILIGEKSTRLKLFLDKKNIPVFEIADDDYPSAFRKWFHLRSLLAKIKPDVIHTHLWRATLLGLTSSWFLKIRKRVFTRHHGTIHYDKFSSGLKWDKLCNAIATDIIAVSNNVKRILIDRDHASRRKLHLIHHGFDIEYFRGVELSTVDELRNKYDIRADTSWPVIGVIARYVDWKGIQYIIPAFEKLLVKYPNAHLILANAQGDFAPTVKRLLTSLPQNTFTEIGFEENLAALYRLFDIYVHAPINANVEAFGQTYIEALASGVPSVFTLSGVASEFIYHGENAMVANFAESESIYSNLQILLENSDLRNKLQINGLKTVSAFDKAIMMSKLLGLYRGTA
jgi:glycosyltransferase involved in cell wall biosynthesis